MTAFLLSCLRREHEGKTNIYNAAGAGKPKPGKANNKSKKPKKAVSSAPISFSEKGFRALIESSADAITLLDAAGVVLYDSPAASGMLGYGPEVWIGKNVFQLIHADDLQKVQDLFRKLVEAPGSHVKSMFRLRRKDNSWLWIEAVGTNLLAEETVKAVVVNYRDITERKRVEEALHQSETNYRSLAENSLQGISIFQDQKIVYINPATCRIYGYAFEEMTSMSTGQIIALTHPQDRDMVMERIRKRTRGEPIPSSIELRILRKDGSTGWIQSFNNAIEYNGRPALLSTNMDITERKRAEEALTASELRYRILAEASQDMITLINRQWEVEYTNTFGARAFGAAPDELTGKRLADLFPPEIAKRQQDNLQRVFESGQPFYIEAPVAFPGSTQWLGTWLAPIKGPDGQTNSVLVVSRDITARKIAEESLQRSLEQVTHGRSTLQALSLAAQAAQRAHTPQAIYQAVGDEIKKLGFNLIIYDFDDKKGELSVAFVNFAEALLRTAENLVGVSAKSHRFPVIPGGYHDQILSAGKAVFHIDSTEITAEVLPPFLRPLTGQVVRIFGATPAIYAALMVDKKPQGMMVVLGVDLGEVDLPAVDILAAQIAIALKNAQLFESVQRQLEHLQALRTIDIAISSSFDLRLTLEILLKQVVVLLRTDAAAISLFHTITKTLEYAGGRGFRSQAIREARVSLGEELAGQAIQERRTVHITNLLESKSKSDQAMWLKSEEFVEYYCVPLLIKGEIKGALEVFHREPLAEDADWLGLLETLARQAAIAIDSAQLFDGLNRSNVELMLAYDATIEGWSAALDLRDKETEGHSRRVTEMTVELARRIGIGESELVHIRRGALLHDMGKLGVPDHILLKPDKLTDEEWHIMHAHPVHAYEMLLPINYLKPALDIPHAHHEKWDGTGYPLGLKGENIPLAARIFAIVDVWDAITSDRPYRAAWSKEKALEFIKNESGKHFDPQVVEGFLGMIANK